MADVYAAEHIRLGCQFAIKVIHVNRSGAARDRFRREARSIARIENDFVVKVVDCGETDDQMPYLVMERLHGEDLRSLIERATPLPIPRAVNLIWQACQGIAAVHAAGLVHRDVKPENLYVTRRSTGEDWCKVLDFGVAKSEMFSSTMEGALIGTIGYMAPEQLQDGSCVKVSADLYALGAVLYESLSGSPPHTGTSVQELMFKILNEEPVQLCRLRSEIPIELARVVTRALQKEPARRFSDAAAFARALAPFQRAGAFASCERKMVTLHEHSVRRYSTAKQSDPRSAVFAAILSASVLVPLFAGDAPRAMAKPRPASLGAASQKPVERLDVEISESCPLSGSAVVELARSVDPTGLPILPNRQPNRRASHKNANDYTPSSVVPSGVALPSIAQPATPPRPDVQDARLWQPGDSLFERRK